MKKTAILLALLLVVSVSAFAFENESEYSYRNIPLQKVYNNQNGYIAMYTLDGYKVSTSYLPMDWFRFGDNRGHVIELPKGLYPYMTIVYKNNEFQYVTLAVPKNPGDPFWGLLTSNSEDLKAKFAVDKFEIN
ncbi:MAG: hypothetical protein IKK38_10130 [Spirochaetaceae bacterium]|nr:hypothetical protein [Spirochaetaceae bacterium]MBR3814215.1 hypothetical protein [Spirochaetaceae bacterium]MDD6486513.1 hypothetical protein [Spirochaetales bacterium]